MRLLLPLLISLFILNSCDTSMSSNTKFSDENTSDLANKTIVATPGKFEIVKDSFLFFIPNKKQGVFLYPKADVSLFKTHFFIQINVGDVITCGIIQTQSHNKKLSVHAELEKTYKGDVSGIGDLCSGRGARIYINDGKTTTTIPTKVYKEYEKLKSPKIIFPYIPFFLPAKLTSIASPSNNEPKILVQIEFFDRISKTTITNCTYYTIDGVESPVCYGVPIIYPETSFYGNTYKSRHMRSIHSQIEYIEQMVATK